MTNKKNLLNNPLLSNTSRPQKFVGVVICIIICFLTTSCYTGVESTKKIELSRNDVKATTPTAEDKYLDSVSAAPLSEWKIGKSFLVSDDRALLTFLSRSVPQELTTLKGRILKYIGTEINIRPDGIQTLLIRFTDGKYTLLYDTGKSEYESNKSFTSDALETLIDLDIISDLNKLMQGKTYWTRSPIWYDSQERIILGQKYIPVSIDSVTAGTLIFPIRVYFTDSNKNSAHYLMSLSNRIGASSRRFSTLFYLDDLKKKYSGINDEVWKLIQECKVREGMTKEECRLSLGDPKESSSGHNYSVMFDTWIYDGGRYLQFEDGLLVRFRY